MRRNGRADETPGRDGYSVPGASAPRPGNRRGTGGTLPPVATRFKPGTSGNWAGRPQGDRRVRGIILEALNLSRRKAVEAMRRRLESVKYVQDVLELLAKLEGELSKDASDRPRGIEVIILNNQGDTPLNPEVFREGVLARMRQDAAREAES